MATTTKAELEAKFLEVRDKVPYQFLGKKNGEDGQTMYGNIMDWCRDYFGGPKDSALAYMLIGYWYTENEIRQRVKQR